MAIFDSDKRPRGLRVPSLTAMKNGTAATKSQFSFHNKKSPESQLDTAPAPTLKPVVPTPAPVSQFQAKPAPPPNKDLPPTPKEEDLPQAVSAQVTQAPPRTSSKMPLRKEVLRKPPPGGNAPVAGAPKMGLRQPSQPAPAAGIMSAGAMPQASQDLAQSPGQLQSRPAQSQLQPAQMQAQAQAQSPMTSSLPVYNTTQTTPGAPTTVRSQQPAKQNQISQGSISSANPVSQSIPPSLPHPADLTQGQQLSFDSSTPLEDFIPTPDGGSTPLDPTSSDEQASTTPSDEIDVIPAPLSKIHYACFQEHRNMPVAQNTWCPVPCMTCHKADREIRHRCVFCCLRVCEGCYGALQKCRGRSLTELMSQLR